MIIKKSPAEIERIAAAGAILVKTMSLLQAKIRPGVTTGELDPKPNPSDDEPSWVSVGSPLPSTPDRYASNKPAACPPFVAVGT